ncbi:hypothetical protein BDV93DRAFT_97168 [Ceratobasidium sp. AG-I]|nr:hypothetical protein BDV93DRAFT_97168 [Ceratobasidium sp. AG-I]
MTWAYCSRLGFYMSSAYLCSHIHNRKSSMARYVSELLPHRVLRSPSFPTSYHAADFPFPSCVVFESACASAPNRIGQRKGNLDVARARAHIEAQVCSETFSGTAGASGAWNAGATWIQGVDKASESDVRMPVEHETGRGDRWAALESALRPCLFGCRQGVCGVRA